MAQRTHAAGAAIIMAMPGDGDGHRAPEGSLDGYGSPSGGHRKAYPKWINLPVRPHVVEVDPVIWTESRRS